VRQRQFPPRLLERIAARFKALGEPTRLAILNELRHGEQTVSTIVERTAASQANVSKHLALLFRERLVARRKEGLNVFYRIVDPALFELCDSVCDALEVDLERERAELTEGDVASG
jgi:DNA-binding transcriptional ArsR family regulator